MGSNINIAKPAESVGLTAVEAAKRLVENGPNQLTPPVKKVRCEFREFLTPSLLIALRTQGAWRKYFESLSSLFNLLLIAAGILLFILLGVDYAANYANVYIGTILIVSPSIRISTVC